MIPDNIFGPQPSQNNTAADVFTFAHQNFETGEVGEAAMLFSGGGGTPNAFDRDGYYGHDDGGLVQEQHEGRSVISFLHDKG